MTMRDLSSEVWWRPNTSVSSRILSDEPTTTTLSPQQHGSERGRWNGLSLLIQTICRRVTGLGMLIVEATPVAYSAVRRLDNWRPSGAAGGCGDAGEALLVWIDGSGRFPWGGGVGLGAAGAVGSPQSQFAKNTRFPCCWALPVAPANAWLTDINWA
jgi:hypothetical protein